MPDDTKSLIELLEKFQESGQFMDQKVAELLRIRPDLFKFEMGPDGRETVASYQLGKIAGIILMDWLCWAFDKAHLGYVHPPGEGLDPPGGPY